jgi:hypothetical protein
MCILLNAPLFSNAAEHLVEEVMADEKKDKYIIM